MTVVIPTAIEHMLNIITNEIRNLRTDRERIGYKMEMLENLRSECETLRDTEAKMILRAKSS